MINPQFFSPQQIILALKTHYGIIASLLTPVAGGADLDAQTYKAEGIDQKTYFVKLKQGHDQTVGIALQSALYEAGIAQLIAPIKTIDQRLCQPLDGFMLTVYPFIIGKNGFDLPLDKNQWIALGHALRQIHTFALPLSIKENIRREDFSPRWREAVRSIYATIDVEKDNDPFVQKVLDFMKKHQETILRLVTIADRQATAIRKKDLDFVLCHTDIHAGNVLIQDDGTIFIVDWDAPLLAPKERDLMFIGGGVGNVWNDPEGVEFFYQGYGATIIDMSILTYYRCERILEDIAIYYHDLLKPDTENKAEIFMFLNSIFDPNGVVDIALATEKAVRMQQFD